MLMELKILDSQPAPEIHSKKRILPAILLALTAIGLGLTSVAVITGLAMLKNAGKVVESSQQSLPDFSPDFFVGIVFGLALVVFLKWGMRKEFSLARGFAMVLVSTAAYLAAYYSAFYIAASNWKP